jgi:GGDEF domain-containing protein
VSVPEDHTQALLAALAGAEQLAYVLLSPTDLSLVYLSPDTEYYGLSAHSLGQPLLEQTAWGRELGARLQALAFRGTPFDTALSSPDGHRWLVHAGAAVVGGQTRILLILRDPDALYRRKGGARNRFHPMTGLYSAAFMDEKLDEELARLQRYSGRLSVLAISCPDTVGPEDLPEAADLLRIHFRATDTAGHAHGGEFMVLLPGTDLAHARQASERIRTVFEDWRFGSGRGIMVACRAVEACAMDSRIAVLARLAQAERTQGEESESSRASRPVS